MSQKSEWLPGTRIGQCALCKDWMSVLSAGAKAASWDVPPARVTELDSAAAEADTALGAARPKPPAPHGLPGRSLPPKTRLRW
jgi:hypothetical protein